MKAETSNIDDKYSIMYSTFFKGGKKKFFTTMYIYIIREKIIIKVSFKTIK